MTQGLCLSGRKVSLCESKSSLTKSIQQEKSRQNRPTKLVKTAVKSKPRTTDTKVSSPYLKRLTQSAVTGAFVDTPLKPSTGLLVPKSKIVKDDPRPKTSALILSQSRDTSHPIKVKIEKRTKPVLHTLKPPIVSEPTVIPSSFPQASHEMQKAEQLSRLARRAKLLCLNDLLQSIERANFEKLKQTNAPSSTNQRTLSSISNVHAV